MSRYLSRAGFERYHFSGGWVFPCWVGFSQRIKHEFGDYPQREMLVELAKMNKAEREEHVWFGVYLWEARKQSRTAASRAKPLFLTANEVTK